MAFKFPAPIVVCFGEEGFFLDRDYGVFKKQASDRQIIELNGKDLEDYELVSIAETHTMDGRSKLLLVDNAEKIKPEKALKAYVEKLEAKDLSVVTVLIMRGGKCPAFWPKLSKDSRKAYLKEYPKLKTFDSNNQVLGFIEDELRRVGVRFDAKVPEMIFNLAGADLHALRNEIQKFGLLVGAGNILTLQHVGMILTVGANTNVWQVIDAASRKEKQKALNLLSSLYRFSAEDPSIGLAYALMKQVERLYVGCTLRKKGASSDDIAPRIGMHPYPCRTTFMPMVEKHTVESLGSMMQKLCKLDVEIKRTSHSKRTLLELAVLHLAS